jgi:TPR repeat protein
MLLVLPGCVGRTPPIDPDRQAQPYSHINGILSMTTEMDCDEAARLFRASVDQGDTRSMVNLGRLNETYCRLRKVANASDYPDALYAAAAERGDPVGQTNLGARCLNSRPGFITGCSTYRDAADWFAKAADQGYMRALVYLGYMHERGFGVFQPDREAAAALYRQASAKGEKLGDVFLWDMENLEMRKTR